jgi:OFA family oxalate/formate antiporter-like MFS transporter
MIAAMILALFSGIGYAWSVFQKPLLTEFNWALETISLTFTIQVLVSTIAPVFLSGIQKKIGVKNYLIIGILIYTAGMFLTSLTSSLGYLYILYGLVVGIGIAILFPTLIAYATSLFPDKTGMASGLLACSYGSGAILWAPIAQSLMNNYNILTVFTVFGVAFLIIMIPVSLFIKNIPGDYKVQSPKKVHKELPKVRDYHWKEMLKTGTFYILLTTLILGTTAGLMIAGHASGMLQEILSLTPEKAAVLVGLFSVFNALGRLLFGFVSDKLGRYNVMMILFGIIGISMIILFKTTGGIFIAALLTISSCYGGFTSMFSPVCADNFGMKNLAVNYTFLYVAYGLAGLIGPQLAARIKESFGGYQYAFVVVAVLAVFGLAGSFYLKTRVSKNLKLSQA